MGYFSNLDGEYLPIRCDHSYTPPEKQLLWRLEELENRLDELSQQTTGMKDNGICFCREALRYVLPEDFLSVSDVRKAIDLAETELAERYGIYVHGKPEKDLPEMDEITGLQISFLDIPAFYQTMNHAFVA